MISIHGLLACAPARALGLSLILVLLAAPSRVAAQEKSQAATPGADWTERSKTAKTVADERAFASLAKLHERNYADEAFRGTGFFGCAYIERVPDDPRDALCALGLDAVPALVEALADNRETKTVTVTEIALRVEEKTWKVNELVARILVDVCGRDFATGSEENLRSLAYFDGDPAFVPAFQRLVLDWYRSNKDATEVERRIALLEDSFIRNRLDAAGSAT